MKRLLFDRRYGWVVDEWKDPSEEALAGGRGMFCILPITKSLLRIASQLMTNFAASAIRTLENPPQLSVQALRANFISQCERFVHLIQKANFKLVAFPKDSPGEAV